MMCFVVTAERSSRLSFVVVNSRIEKETAFCTESAVDPSVVIASRCKRRMGAGRRANKKEVETKVTVNVRAT
jgi:hypothetical protein